MLVLTRRIGERVIIDHQGVTITVELVAMRGAEVRLGIEAPADVTIERAELGDER